MVGDFVVYRKTKYSEHPGTRAKQVRPSAGGEDYTYLIDKFWIVTEIRDDGKLLLETRRGKQHVVDVDDANLRLTTIWDRMWNRSRLPRPIAQ